MAEPIDTEHSSNTGDLLDFDDIPAATSSVAAPVHDSASSLIDAVDVPVSSSPVSLDEQASTDSTPADAATLTPVAVHGASDQETGSGSAEVDFLPGDAEANAANAAEVPEAAAHQDDDDVDERPGSLDSLNDEAATTTTTNTSMPDDDAENEAVLAKEDGHASTKTSDTEQPPKEGDDEGGFDAQDDEWNDFDQQFDENDDFGDFDDFTAQNDDNDDDGFGEFDDFEPPKEPTAAIAPAVPGPASHYVDLLASDPSAISDFVSGTLDKLWTPLGEDETENELKSDDEVVCGDTFLSTACSQDLWDKLSRDTVFYNAVTGSIGQFQWTRSDTNRAYLNALGVRINYDDRYFDTRSTSMASSPIATGTPGATPSPRPLSHTQPSPRDRSANAAADLAAAGASSSHTRSSSLTNGLSMVANGSPPSEHPQVEEPELDIDIARAYCELTEETIRVFPDVKLNAMVVELTRLQRQAKEYLGYLLDQREQLMMDAETYNDLISCIVGHAQRLREQHAVKDASPAMVSKKKRGFSSMIKRKNTTGAAAGTSMGGGVVGIQASTSTSKSRHPGESRRSM
ncbi:hypothetical protein BC940DRAFT_299848 [Gongronella butleri]|nr:hypothetical protein BC940DRAFT_299848 [Gongronella butleri]